MAEEPRSTELAAFDAASAYFNSLNDCFVSLCQALSALDAAGVFDAQRGRDEWQAMLVKSAADTLSNPCSSNLRARVSVPGWARKVLGGLGRSRPTPAPEEQDGEDEGYGP